MKKYYGVIRIRKCLIATAFLVFCFFAFAFSVGAETEAFGIGSAEWDGFVQAIPPEAEEYFSQESFSDYLLNSRLQHARNMLLTSNKTLSEISMECGFCDSNYLCFRFRKKFGQSPHQFRLKNNPFFK